MSFLNGKIVSYYAYDKSIYFYQIATVLLMIIWCFYYSILFDLYCFHSSAFIRVLNVQGVSNVPLFVYFPILWRYILCTCWVLSRSIRVNALNVLFISVIKSIQATCLKHAYRKQSEKWIDIEIIKTLWKLQAICILQIIKTK